MSDAVIYEPKGHVANITLNRPNFMNRLDMEMVDGLHCAWTRL